MKGKIKPSIEFVDEGGEFYGKNQIDYQRTLMAHILAMSKLVCWIPYLSNKDLNPTISIDQLRSLNYESLNNSTIFLEALLSPYRDQKYVSRISALKLEIKERAEEFPDSSENDRIKYEAFKKFAYLIQLMGRKELLLVEKIEAIIG